MSPPLTQSAAGDKVLRRVDTGDDIEGPAHGSSLVVEANERVHDMEARVRGCVSVLNMEMKRAFWARFKTEEWRDKKRDTHRVMHTKIKRGGGKRKEGEDD